MNQILQASYLGFQCVYRRLHFELWIEATLVPRVILVGNIEGPGNESRLERAPQTQTILCCSVPEAQFRGKTQAHMFSTPVAYFMANKGLDVLSYPRSIQGQPSPLLAVGWGTKHWIPSLCSWSRYPVIFLVPQGVSGNLSRTCSALHRYCFDLDGVSKLNFLFPHPFYPDSPVMESTMHQLSLSW